MVSHPFSVFFFLLNLCPRELTLKRVRAPDLVEGREGEHVNVHYYVQALFDSFLFGT